MKNRYLRKWFLVMSIFLCLLLVGGCSSQLISTVARLTATPLPATPTPSATATPTPTAVPPTPTQAELDAWGEIGCFDMPAFESFLEKYPDGGKAHEARLYLQFDEKIAKLKTGEESPKFFIPLQDLGPRWQSWKQRRPERGGIAYQTSEQQGNTILSLIFLFPGCNVMSFDEYGSPAAPTGHGSIIAFQSNGLKLEFLNSIMIESDGEEILYFAIVDNLGLVHLHGRGRITTPDGTEIELN